MFIHHTLNKYINTCISCENTPKINIELGYHVLPFKYLKNIETYIFNVNICHYCHLNSANDKKIYKKIIKNSCELLDIFLR